MDIIFDSIIICMVLKILYISDSPESDLCDVVDIFFNTIHFKLLKIFRLVSGPASDTRKNFLTDSHKLNLLGSLKSVITKAFLPCL